MELSQVLVTLLAGLGAGLVVAAVGAGSLVSFPLLLSTGLAPVVANVCNTVGLVPGGLSGSWGFRAELAGKSRLVAGVAATSACGALIGAVVLLALPSEAFARAVPLLVIAAATLVGVQPLVSAWVRRHRPDTFARTRPEGLPPVLRGISALVGVYGGYFGAGQGVMLVAFLALGLDQPMAVVNGLKNVAVLAANLAASVVFVLVAPLDWAVVGLVAAGSVVGGWAGAHIGRRLPAAAFRTLVVVFGYLVGFRLLLGGV